MSSSVIGRYSVDNLLPKWRRFLASTVFDTYLGKNNKSRNFFSTKFTANMCLKSHVNESHGYVYENGDFLPVMFTVPGDVSERGCATHG